MSAAYVSVPDVGEIFGSVRYPGTFLPEIELKNVEQPDDEFPDVIVELTDGTVIAFELGEWLDGTQMAAAKRYDALSEAIINALGRGANPSRHCRAVMLTPREDTLALTATNRGGFRTQFWV